MYVQGKAATFNARNRRLIISTGDTSDVDGFISVAMYAQTGADLLFIINLPAPYDPSKEWSVTDEEVLRTIASDNSRTIAEEFNKYPGAMGDYGKGYTYKRNASTGNLLVKMCIVLVTRIWKENKGEKLYFAIGEEFGDTYRFYYNDVNPFGHILLHDLDVYKDVYKSVLTNTETFPDLKSFPFPELNRYAHIYMDMNGSCAFYRGSLKATVEKIVDSDKFRGLYVMGGVEGFKESSTQKSLVLNRIPIATMNQVYAPRKAGELIMHCIQCNRPVFFVSNNEVNTHGSYTGDEVRNLLDQSLVKFVKNHLM
jgi:hypothetical protein